MRLPGLGALAAMNSHEARICSSASSNVSTWRKDPVWPSRWPTGSTDGLTWSQLWFADVEAAARDRVGPPLVADPPIAEHLPVRNLLVAPAAKR